MILNTDGGARGNPGPAACGAVLKDNYGSILRKEGLSLGTTTNNEAEYQGLLLGLKIAAEEGEGEAVEVNMDSQLVVNQLNGLYKVKEPRLLEFFKKVRDAEKSFSKVTYKYVPREKNKEADKLVNEVLDAASPF